MSSILKVDTIQDQSGNNIINENADTITIGASGDTITIPSGATLSSTDPLVFPAGTVSLPSITTTGDTNTGIFFPAADTIAFSEGGAEAMRIDSSGRVGIGTVTPSSKLEISGNAAINYNMRNTLLDNNGEIVSFQWDNNADFTIQGRDSNAGFKANWYRITSTDTDGLADEHIWYTGTSAERMRIDSSGNVMVGTTNNNPVAADVAGTSIQPAGTISIARAGNTFDISYINTNGSIMNFYQNSGSLAGSISASGTIISYNAFTGSHWSRFVDNVKPDLLLGTVIESLDTMVDWYVVEFEVSTTEKDLNGNDIVKNKKLTKYYGLKDGEKEGDIITYNYEGKDYEAIIKKQEEIKHVYSKISDTVEAKNVYGVFSAWDNDDLINNDFYVASVGSFVVRIKQGETVNKGDLLQSNGDGTAKVQADDLVRASSFAKVLSNTVIETYEDGSFIVPCSLMC